VQSNRDPVIFSHERSYLKQSDGVSSLLHLIMCGRSRDEGSKVMLRDIA
jgi:hypothetical protein